MTRPTPRSLLVPLALAIALGACNTVPPNGNTNGHGKETISIHYLEIVTPDVPATCAALEQTHGVTFASPDPALGNARTAPLDGGGRMGVRAPLRPDEAPVVRPYRLVENIEAAVEAAQAAGAQIALPPMPIPGGGQYAIYIQGGIEHGLWQL